MDPRRQLLALLADGRRRPAAALATALGTDPTALGALAARLADWGVELAPGADDSLGLLHPLDALDGAAIAAALAPATRAACASLEVLVETASTNGHLLAAPPAPPGGFRAALAEFQSAGRGRRGRAWVTPFGAGLLLSYGAQFATAPAALAPLTLAVGVGLTRALGALGVPALSLKWPNDLLQGGAKLGGVLCELKADAPGRATVVVGVGLNVTLTPATRAAIRAAGGLAPAALADLPNVALARNALAARVLEAVHAVAVEYAAAGLAPFREEWLAADALRDRPVRVLTPQAERDGIARGIDADGALRVEFGGRVEPVVAGDVSLRAVA